MSGPTTSSATGPQTGGPSGCWPSWTRTRGECLRLDVARRRRSDDVLARLAQLFVERGPPTSLRSDNGPACTATAVRDWMTRVGVTTLFIEPGSPWENGAGESFTGTLRDAGLNRERFDTLLEAQVLIEGWRLEYNQIRPHSALGYRPPAPETLAIQPPHPADWADRRVPALTSRLVQRSGAGQSPVGRFGMKEVVFWGMTPPASAMIRLAAAREGVHVALSVAENGAASLAPQALAAHTVPVAVESMRVASDHAETAVCDLPAAEIQRGGGMHTSG